MLKALLESIQNDQRARYELYRHWARKLDEDMTSVDGTDQSYSDMYGSELSINEALNTLETLHAQIFKSKILPVPCPSDGDYEDEFQARAYGRWLEGVLDDTKAHTEVVPQAGWDCLWAGTGLVKGFWRPEGKRTAKLFLESVSPRHVYVDRSESRAGRPRSIHQKMFMDRWVVAELFCKDDPELERKVLGMQESSTMDDDLDASYKQDGDQITVWESWHLPSSPTSNDGLHCIWIQDATLFKDKWTHNRFPFTVMRFGQRIAGFWGKSALRRILPAQNAFDRITKQIDECHDVMGKPRIIVRKDSGLQKSHIDDLNFSIIETESPTSDIKEWNPTPIHPSMYQERDGLTRRMRGAIGVSDFEAQNALPPNIRDGAAAYMDRALEAGQARHAMLHEQHQMAIIDLADLCLMVALEAYDAGYDVVARAPGNEMKTTVQMIKFSEVKVKRETLKLRVLPMNKLARTMADRLKDLTLLRDRGDITQKTYLRLIEIPDTEAEVDLYVSDEDIIKRNLSYMIRTGNYVPPLPYDNHDLIVKFGAQKIHECRVREVDEDKVALIVQYIEEAIEMKGGMPDTNQPAPVDPMLGPTPDPSAAFGPGAPPVGPPGAPPPVGPPPGAPPPMGPPMGPPGPPVMGP